MTLNNLGAFVAGVIIPLIIALLGREPIGRWFMAGQRREDTALSALVQLAQESIAGWRESNTAIIHLSKGLDIYREEADKVRNNIFGLLESQGDKLASLDSKVEALIHILAEGGK